MTLHRTTLVRFFFFVLPVFSGLCRGEILPLFSDSRQQLGKILVLGMAGNSFFFFLFLFISHSLKAAEKRKKRGKNCVIAPLGGCRSGSGYFFFLVFVTLGGGKLGGAEECKKVREE